MSIATQLSLKQLRAIVAVYRHGKLSTAAAHLSVTESAVSVMVRQAESVLKVRLFDRTTRSLEPTNAAAEAVVIAERILHDVELLASGFEELSEGRRGRVHVVTTPAVGTALMPAVVRKFKEQYPHVRLVLDDCAPDQFLPRILSSEVDFGIGTPEQEDAEIEMDTLIDDQLCLVCADDHPLAGRSQVRWEELADLPLIAFRAGYGMRRKLDAVAFQTGVKLRIDNEVNFVSSALWMTAGGMGASIWSSVLVAQTPFANLTRCELIAPRVQSRISIVHKRGRSLSPAAQGFIEMLRREVGGKAKPAARGKRALKATT